MYGYFQWSEAVISGVSGLYIELHALCGYFQAASLSSHLDYAARPLLVEW